MAIYKAKIHSKFVTIPNSTAQDNRLSWEARGLLSFILSQAENFEIHKSWLINQFDGCGRDKMTRMLGELIDFGYCRKEVKQNESGQMQGVNWLVFAEPFSDVEPPEQRLNRTTENPLNGEPATNKEKGLTIKTINNKNKDSLSVKKFTDEDLKCAEWFFGLIQDVMPKAKQPNLEKWADTIRLMRERDNRTIKEIAFLMKWSNSDKFWKTNILSPDKLRGKFDALWIKANPNGGPNGGGTPRYSSKDISNANAIMNTELD